MGVATTTIDDIRAALVDSDFTMDESLIANLINRAETVIELQGYDISRIRPEAVKIVVSGMVKRVILNPDGIRQESETTGPTSRSITYAGASPGELFLTSEDRALLSGKRRRGAFTINPAPSAMDGYGRLGSWWE